MSASTAAKTSAQMAPKSSPTDSLKESRVIYFSTLQAFRTAIQHLSKNLSQGQVNNEYLIVKDVDKNTMDRIENLEYSGVRCEWHEDLEILIVKVPTKAHETAAAQFGAEIDFAARIMGLPREEHQLIGAGTNSAQGGSPKKEPDWSMVNTNIRPNPADFPSIVVEVGFSETLPKLREDAELWFSMSNNTVQIVILIAIHRTNNQIIFEKWTVQPTGRRATRHTPSQLPQAEQEITITRTPPNTFTITNGAAPLVLEFNRLFLRQPVGGEHDIRLTQMQLIGVARDVFRIMARIQ
jgi:hypothetical protein